MKKVDILLVDDRPDGLLAMEAVLSCPDYNLVKASSGHDALRLLGIHDFAVILLDIQMPGMDGFETAERIKRNPAHKNIPIIFVTAINKDTRYVNQGYEAGAFDYLFKPFNPLVLKSKVSIFVDLYRQNRQMVEQTKLLAESEEKFRLLV